MNHNKLERYSFFKSIPSDQTQFIFHNKIFLIIRIFLLILSQNPISYFHSKFCSIIRFEILLNQISNFLLSIFLFIPMTPKIFSETVIRSMSDEKNHQIGE